MNDIKETPAPPPKKYSHSSYVCGFTMGLGVALVCGDMIGPSLGLEAGWVKLIGVILAIIGSILFAGLQRKPVQGPDGPGHLGRP